MSVRDVVYALVLVASGFAVGFAVGRDNPVSAIEAVAPGAPGPDPTLEPTAPVVGMEEDVGAPAEPVAAASKDEPDASTTTPAAPDGGPAPADAGGWLVPADTLPKSAESLPEAVRRRLPNTAFSLAEIPLLGDVFKARVSIVVFGDFQCAHTKEGMAELERLSRKFGPELVVGFRHFPLGNHENARGAALASFAAFRQAKFWEYARVLLDHQAELDDAHLRAYAGEVGLDVARFDTDRASEAASVQLSVDKAVADMVEVEGTPTLLVNGYRIVGTPAGEVLESVIAGAYAEVQSYQDKGDSLFQARGKACDRASMRMPLKGKSETNIPNLHNLPLSDAPRKGATDPLVGVVVFSDFDCASCRTMSGRLDRLLAAHPEEVALGFRHFPALTAGKGAGRDAALAAAFADDHGKFWPLHDRLFGQGAELGRKGLLEVARSLGLDAALLEKSLANETHIETLRRDQLLAARIGVGSSPVVFVNGRRLAAETTDDQLEQAFKDATEQATRFMKKYGVKREGYYAELMGLVPPN